MCCYWRLRLSAATGFAYVWWLTENTEKKSPNCRVEVFTRWGQRVFSSTGYRTPWDGNSGGKDLPEGTYFYTTEPGEEHEAVRGMVVLGRKVWG